MVESLLRIGAVHAKNKPLSNHQLKSVRTNILFSSSGYNQTDATSKPKKSKVRKRSINKNAVWLERKRETLMLVASLLATMAFQAGVNPPSGVWQDTTPDNSSSIAPAISSAIAPDGSSSIAPDSSSHEAGYSVLADNFPRAYTYFLIANTTGFVASLSIILLLISALPIKHRFFMWTLMVIMWIAITAMALTYLVSLYALTPTRLDNSLLDILGIVVLVWMGLMLLLLLGHTIRLTIRLIKFLSRLVIRLINACSTALTGA